MRRYHRICVGACLALLFSICAWAGPSEPEQLRDKLESSVQQASQVGKETAAWQMEKQRLLSEIQDFELKAAWADYQLEKTEKWLATEQNNVETLAGNLKKAASTREQLEPLLEVFYADLEDHVRADLSFLADERKRRLAHIRSTLDDPEASLSDKLGRLFEAMQVEVDYGYSVDVTEELVKNSEGEDTQAVVFRLGRLSLFRFLEGNSRLERYDRDRGVWQEIAESSVLEVEKAIEIARKKRVGSVLFLPVGPVSELPQAQSAKVAGHDNTEGGQ